MKVLQCLAVDDEPHALELLEAYIEKVPFLNLYKATTSAWEALNIIQQTTIDLLFLDIQMEELTGLQFLDISKKTCPVIITSAYAEYALEGYNYQVEDYLLKPFSFERFLKAVTNIQSKYGATSAAPIGAADVAAPANPKNGLEYIFIKGDAKNKFHQIKLKDILFIEGLKNYVQFHCKTQRIITLQNLKDLEAFLVAQGFMRVHRSFIVHLDAIEKVEGHQIKIKETMIPIGQNYRDTFYQALNERGLNNLAE